MGYNQDVYKRVKELSAETGIRTLDRYHFSFAEYAGADILLTTDDKFERACSKIDSAIRVINPLTYLLEVMRNGHDN